jgi:hypothetical protein
MNLIELDSRNELGSDVNRFNAQKWARSDMCRDFRETSSLYTNWTSFRHIRVIVGRLGNSVRLSAPALDLTEDGSSFKDAWKSFLDAVSKREDSPWLMFDVGPTNRDEITAGLDADPDEIWADRDTEEGA